MLYFFHVDVVGRLLPLSFPSQSIFNAQHSAARDHEPEHVPRVPCPMPHATWPHGARCGNMICLLHRVAFGIGAEESHAPVSECSEKPLTQTGQVASDGFLHVGCGLKRLPD